MSLLKRVAKTLKSKEKMARFRYVSLLDRNLPIDENVVLFQTFDGISFGGNPYYILREMLNDARFQSKKFYIAIREESVAGTKALLANRGMRSARIITTNSRQYCRILATAKYLINNSTFPVYFMKRPGQIYLNTWHGTPLKGMGRKMVDMPHALGNTQRNLLMADYLLYPNKHTFEIFRRDYMLDNLFNGTYVMGGYPCNSELLNTDNREMLKKQFGLEGKRIIVYMPTWRQTVKEEDAERHNSMLSAILEGFGQLGDDTVTFAKLHYYAKNGISNSKTVRTFPKGYETYEILNMADVLVTDYSSVMFDFLNAGKEIILMDYDKDEYYASRSCYLDVSDLPFRQFARVEDLITYLKESANRPFLEKYDKEYARFCNYDNESAAHALVDLLAGEQNDMLELIPGSLYTNDLEKCLIYAGALTKNGITTSLLGFLDYLDYERRNYYLTFTSQHGSKAKDLILNLPDGISYMPAQGVMALSKSEAAARYLYDHFNRECRWVSRKMAKAYSREWDRLFPDICFDTSINFTGYDRKFVHLFLNGRAGNKVIFVHNDMKREWDLKQNYHKPSITKAYREFEKIAVVRDSLKDSTAKDFAIPLEKIHVVHNPNRIEHIKASASIEPFFDENTESTIELNDLVDLLSSDKDFVFINVGRFSPEKSHDRLIDAFERLAETERNISLIIVGSTGNEYNRVLNRALTSKASIHVIRNLTNPLPIVARSDAFVLSSLHEGLPMSIMEALLLDVPVISTSIDGPRQFLEHGYGDLVPNSEDGIYEGMKNVLRKGTAATAQFDAEQFNEQALAEFEALFDSHEKPTKP